MKKKRAKTKTAACKPKCCVPSKKKKALPPGLAAYMAKKKAAAAAPTTKKKPSPAKQTFKPSPVRVIHTAKPQTQTATARTDWALWL